MRPRVLLVDDDPDITRAVSRLLEAEGFEAREVNDAPSALPVARAFLPHAIILDYRMPYMTGADVAWQFAGDPMLKSVPILICSGSPDEISRAQLPPEEIPILPKPFSSKVVLPWLRERLAAQ